MPKIFGRLTHESNATHFLLGTSDLGQESAIVPGRLQDGQDNFPDVLNKLDDLEVLANDKCGSYGSDEITANMLCAYLEGKDSCQNDSGGDRVGGGGRREEHGEGEGEGEFFEGVVESTANINDMKTLEQPKCRPPPPSHSVAAPMVCVCVCVHIATPTLVGL